MTRRIAMYRRKPKTVRVTGFRPVKVDPRQRNLFEDQQNTDYQGEVQQKEYHRGMVWDTIVKMTVAQISARVRDVYKVDQTTGNEVAMLLKDDLQWHEMSKETQDMLYYRHVKDMPYGTAKARTEDPDEWIMNRLPMFLGLV